MKSEFLVINARTYHDRSSLGPHYSGHKLADVSSYSTYMAGSCCSLRQIIEDYHNGLLNNDVGKVEKKKLGKLRLIVQNCKSAKLLILLFHSLSLSKYPSISLFLSLSLDDS